MVFPGVVPVIATLPAPVAEMLEDEFRRTPTEPVPVPYEVPLTVSKPEVAETLDAALTVMPQASVVPFAALAVIVTLPVPVAEMLEDEFRTTPMALVPVPHVVPLTVSEPELLVTGDVNKKMPQAELVPHAALPVIATLPAPVAEMLPDNLR